ncbi:MAG: O-antigen ligase family protein [Phycisphaerales bacterium]|nr:O-antigen ligase family protein [Phycisphaerales bacterium]
MVRTTGSIHALAMVSACVLAPVGGLGDSISLWFFGIAAGAAIPWYSRHGFGVLARPAVVLYGLFWLLVLASTAWSPPAATPAGSAAWTLLAIPAVIPALHRPGLVLWPIAIGVAVQAAIQAGGAAGLIESPGERAWRSSPGLYWYPASVAVWSVTGLLVSLGLARVSGSARSTLAAAGLGMLAAVGLVLTLNRAAWLAGGVGAFLLLARWLWQSRQSHRVGAAALLTLLPLAIAAAAFFGSKTVRYRVHTAVEEVAAVWQSPAVAPGLHPSSFGMRLLWWRAGWDLMWTRPISGHGAGSIAESLARLEVRRPSGGAADVRGFITSNPHCSLTAAAIEQGVPGASLLLLTAIATAIGAWRRGASEIAMSGVGPAVIAMLLIGTVHAVLLEPYSATLAALLVAMSGAPHAAKGLGVDPARRCDTMRCEGD